ncbi:MAG: sulfatase-like hydrolase/transferase [Planctomycetia bacterium]
MTHSLTITFRLAVAVLLGAAGSWPSVAAESRPNFIVVLCDDLGYGDLACFGHPVIETPHLDRMARDGIRLTNCYSAAPVCSPSRVGLLTGRIPARAGVFDWIPEANQAGAHRQSRSLVHLRRDEVTLPALLKQAGYATCLSGKWHCNAHFNSPEQPQPHDAGFDHWFATQNNAAPSHANPVNFVRNGEPAGPLEGYSCQLVVDEVIGWLDRRAEANAREPFFAYVAFHEPHEPVASPPDLVARYRPKAKNDEQAHYFANVANLDAAVGRLLATLDRLGLDDNTLVFFSSDNGPETLDRYPDAKRSYGSPGPLRGMKLWTTEAGSRVAGILRWPGHVPAGVVSDQPVSSLDLLPTFCALAGVMPPAGRQFDGCDIRPLFTSQPIARTTPLMWIYFNALNDQRVALRWGDWKLLARLDGGDLPTVANITETTAGRVRKARLTDHSLYRLTDDIGEAHDLAAEEPAERDAAAAKLEAMYREVTGTMHVWPDPAPAKP